MRTWVVGVGIAMVAACGNDNDNDAPPEPERQDSLSPVRSGSRLKMRWNDVEGVRSLVDVFDSQRNEPCTPLAMADGNTYCAPAGAVTNAFKDASCTQPIYTVFRELSSPCLPLLPYLRIRQASACGTLPYTGISKPVPLTAPMFYVQTSSGSCSQRTTGTFYDLYEPGAEVPLSSLVKLMPAEAEGDGRLTFSYAVAEDGAKLFVGTNDTLLEGRCLMVPTGDAQAQQCVTDFVLASEYGDSACTAPTAQVRQNCTPPKHIAVSQRGCETNVEMYLLGAPTSATSHYWDGQVCREKTPTAGYAHYETGAPVSMEVLQRAAVSAKARIQPIRHVDETVSLHSQSFYDNRLKTDCFVQELPDGSRRCLPGNNASYAGIYFSDPACKSEIRLLGIAAGACESPPLPAVATVYSYANCTATPEVHNVGEPYSGPRYFQGFSGCEQHTSTELAFYQLGAIVPLDTTAEATFITDP